MEVIARKKRGIGVVYLICTLVGILLLGVSFVTPNQRMKLIIFGLMTAAIGGYIYVSYTLLPYEVIRFDHNNVLHLPKERKLAVTDITYVSHRCAHAKGIRYKWGSVIIKTKDVKYAYNYIADCEDVAKRLTDMVKRAKSGDIK